MSELATIAETTITRLDQKPVSLEQRLDEPKPESIRRKAREFVPLRDQVMVRRVMEDEWSEGGNILLPQNGKEKPMEGVVLAVGRGKFDNAGNFYPSELKEGDVVIFGRYSGTEYVVRGEKVLVMRESEIQGVLR